MDCPQNTQNDTKGGLFRDECYAIQGAAFEVYKTLGSGFLEAVYQECLELELKARGIPFVAQSELALSYKGQRLRQMYKPDFVCHGGIILEIKALKELTGEHEAKLLNYLKGSGLRLGLLMNFGHCSRVQIKRMVR